MTTYSIFHYTASQVLLISFIYLLYHVRTVTTFRYVSLKTQKLYLLVFLTRYLDIFWSFWSIYNLVIKIIFISITIAIIYLINYRKDINKTYSKEHDSFWISLPIIFSFTVALFFNVTFVQFPIVYVLC